VHSCTRSLCTLRLPISGMETARRRDQDAPGSPSRGSTPPSTRCPFHATADRGFPCGAALQIERLEALVAETQAELQNQQIEQPKDPPPSSSSLDMLQSKLAKTMRMLEAEAGVTQALEAKLDRTQHQLEEITGQAEVLKADLESERGVNRELEHRCQSFEKRAAKAEKEAHEVALATQLAHFALRTLTPPRTIGPHPPISPHQSRSRARRGENDPKITPPGGEEKANPA
jgi:hypothetical protein